MTRRKVMLITPPYHCGVVEVAGTWMPLTLCYLAASARNAGFDVRIYDAMSLNVGFEEIKAAARDFAPDFVGVTAITATTPDAILTCAAVKEVCPGTLTIMGGVHPSFMDQEVLLSANGAVDWVLRGEAELSFPRLLDELSHEGNPLGVPGATTLQEGRVARAVPASRPLDLDALDCAYDLLDWPIYRYYVLPGSRLGSVSTSRGCDQACTFCSQQVFTNRTWRSRDPRRCAEDIALLNREYGVDVVLITDELPTHDQERWTRFLEWKQRLAPDVRLLMETRASDIVRDKDLLPEYRKAGIIHIYVGAEAVDQSTLDLVNKNLSVDESAHAIHLIKEAGMVTETSFVLGLPDDTEESIANTLKVAKEFDPDFAHFLAIAPWPYAEMYAELEPYIESWDYRRYNLVDPVIKPKSMTRARVDRAIVEGYRTFYQGKLTQLITMKDTFRKEYLLRSMNLIMRSSFIASKMGSLGALPKTVEKAMRALACKHDPGQTVRDRGD